MGALDMKRGYRGVYMTTSHLTQSAIDTFSQCSSTVVALGGEALVEKMIEYGVGVQNGKTYKIQRIDSDFFEDVE